MSLPGNKPAEVVALCRYGDRGASSRVRMLQYVPHLARLGVAVRVLPLLSNAYVESLYQGRFPDVFDVARSYGRRIVNLLQDTKDAVFWVEKELLPWAPFMWEQVFLRRSRRLVVDCDDAMWLRYQGHANPLLRGLLRKKIERVFGCADAVTAGNRWISDHARAAGARDVRLLPSVVDLERYSARSLERAGTPCRIGWIGSPATVHYLRALGPVLRQVAARRPIQVICVGGGPLQLDGVAVESRAWSEATEAAEIRRFDIGVMPLSDGEWERGKCGYKLIQYMACGIPVVGSRVGANREIVAEGQDGTLAGTDAEWLTALDGLMQDANQYQMLGAAGRSKVEQSYSVQARLEELAAVLRVPG